MTIDPARKLATAPPGDPGTARSRPPARAFHRLLAAAILVVASTLLLTCQQPAAKYNVVWIVLDTLRSQNLSCYGYERQTSPNIDALAKRGILYRNHFSQSNSTPLSVPSYLSGRHFPMMYLNYGTPLELWKGRGPDERLVSEILRKAGYETFLVTAHPWLAEGSRVFASFEQAHMVMPAEARDGYAPMKSVVEETIKRLEARNGSPFFLYVHAMDPHWPHVLQEPYTRWLDPGYPNPELARNSAAIFTFEAADQEYLRGLYDGSIHYADAHLGALFDYLTNTGLSGSTIIIISSDHGECLGEDGETIGHGTTRTSDEVFRVPLVIAGPNVAQGHVRMELTENTDIVPSLVRLLGVETDARFDGIPLPGLDLQPFGSSTPRRDFVFAKIHPESYIAKLPALQGPEYRMVLQNSAQKAITNSSFHVEQGWQAPDRLSDRIRLEPKNVVALVNAAKSVLGPRLDAWKLRKPDSPRPFEVILHPNYVTSPDVFIPDARGDDGKWGLQPESLLASLETENVPPIAFEIPIPNGRYALAMRLLGGTYQGKSGGSAISIDHDGVSRLVATDRDDPDYMQWCNAGETEVRGGVFRFTISEGDGRPWALVTSLRFLPLSGADTPTTTGEDMHEQLKSLGYVD